MWFLASDFKLSTGSWVGQQEHIYDKDPELEAMRIRVVIFWLIF